MSGTEQRLDAILMLIERQNEQQDRFHEDLRSVQEKISDVKLLGEKQQLLMERFTDDMKSMGLRVEVVELKSKETADLLNHFIKTASGGTLNVPPDILAKQRYGLATAGFLAIGVAVEMANTIFAMAWQFLAKTALPFVVKVLERASQG